MQNEVLSDLFDILIEYAMSKDDLYFADKLRKLRDAFLEEANSPF